MSGRSPRRFLALAIVATGIAVASVGAWWMLRSRPEPGAIVAVHALSGETALVVRHVEGDERDFLELRDGVDEKVWGGLIGPYPDYPIGLSGIAISGDTAAVRTRAGDAIDVVGFHLWASEKLGRKEQLADLPADRQGGPLQLSSVTALGAGDLIVQLWGDGKHWGRAVATEARMGGDAWRIDLAGMVRGAWIVGPSLAIHVDGTLQLHDLTTGAAIRTLPATSACAVGDRVYVAGSIARGDGASDTGVYEIEAGPDGPVVAPRGTIGQVGLEGVCGRAADSRDMLLSITEIAFVDLASPPTSDGAARGDSVRVDRVTFAGRIAEMSAAMRPHHPVAAWTGRYRPVLVRPDDARQSLVVIDTLERREVSRRDVGPAARLLARGGRALLIDPERGEISAFDSDSGALGRAVAHDFEPDIQPYQLSSDGQVLWLFRGTDLAALDAATLTLRAHLGAPPSLGPPSATPN